VFFAAGYETTATTLSFCTYELALHPQVQEKLYEELKSVSDSRGDIEYDVLCKLPYLDAVLAETLRKYPPAFRISRCSSQDYILADTGIQLFKGQIIEIPILAIHYCEQFFPNPDKFDPDRFLPENRHQIKAYTYLPFGVGPRNCIWMRLALLEAKLSLSKLVQKYTFHPSQNTDVPLKWKVSGLLTPERLIAKIKKR
jgi:cytochrome P450